MKAEVKKLWLDALRSGEYKQTTNTLRRVDKDGSESFCCLGVLCDVAKKNGLDLPVEEKLSAWSGDTVTQYGDHKSEGVLPDEVKDWAELESVDPRVTFEYTSRWEDYDGNPQEEVEEIHDALSGANDDYSQTFEQIAQYIEDQL